ncbi:MAG: 7-cyano-7-deazaguanine synthase [Candidatus Binatia bacterium]
MKTALLVSGGLDSCVMLRALASAEDPVTPVYVRTGLLWESAELHWVERFLAAADLPGTSQLKILDLPVGDLYGRHWSLTGEAVPGFETRLDSNYLPGRNLLLLSKVAVFAALKGIERIAMAPLTDNPFPDGSLEFFRAFEAAARLALSAPLRIEVPFRALDKAEVIRRGKGLPLDLTFSCIRPDGFEHCGDCTKCAERQRGFSAAGVADPTRYRKTAVRVGR